MYGYLNIFHSDNQHRVCEREPTKQQATINRQMYGTYSSQRCRTIEWNLARLQIREGNRNPFNNSPRYITHSFRFLLLFTHTHTQARACVCVCVWWMVFFSMGATIIESNGRVNWKIMIETINKFEFLFMRLPILHSDFVLFSVKLKFSLSIFGPAELCNDLFTCHLHSRSTIFHASKTIDSAATINTIPFTVRKFQLQRWLDVIFFLLRLSLWLLYITLHTHSHTHTHWRFFSRLFLLFSSFGHFFLWFLSIEYAFVIFGLSSFQRLSVDVYARMYAGLLACSNYV